MRAGTESIATVVTDRDIDGLAPQSGWLTSHPIQTAIMSAKPVETMASHCQEVRRDIGNLDGRSHRAPGGRLG
jgi:hypothetical protein